jgi:hypothetical protein
VSKQSRNTKPGGATAPSPAASSRSTTPSGRSAAAPRPPLQRYRGAIVGVAVAAVVLVGGAFLFLGASAPAYACSTVLAPSPAPTAAPDATPRLGQVTRDLGRAHVETGERVTYEFCPPTSGAHYNGEPDGPIPTRFYSSKESPLAQGWVHNLEHGQMVVLYRCPEGCTDSAQAALQALQPQLPPSPLCAFPASESVAVAPFDDMPTPYAALTWGRVMFLDSLDVAAIATFSAQSADRGPEPECQNAVPGASPSAAPSATPAP